MIIKFIKGHNYEIQSPNYEILSHKYVKMVTYQIIVIRFLLQTDKSQNYYMLNHI